MQTFAKPDTAAPERARQEYLATLVKMDDLVEGRHVIVVPKEVLTQTVVSGDRAGEQYDVINSDVIILDGRKTAKIPKYPHIECGLWITGRDVVNELREFVGKGPVLGFFRMKGKAFYMDDPDPDVENGKFVQDAWDLYESGAGPAQRGEPPF